MNEARERIARLRECMKSRGIDGYIVVTADFHESEYVGDYFKCREYLSGFTGSAGTLAVTQQDACLWTDGRYFVQAAAQLKDSGIRLMKMGQEGVPTLEAYLEEALPQGGCLGFDGRTLSTADGKKLKKALAAKKVRFAPDQDLAGEIWENRPPMSQEPAWVLTEAYAGKKAQDKIQDLRQQMQLQGADVHILTSLDDIAWLFNLRGGDVRYNPVLLSYAMIFPDKIYFFANERTLQGPAWAYMDPACETTVRQYLEGLQVQIFPYGQIYQEVSKLSGRRILLDAEKVNYALSCRISKDNKVMDRPNPTTLAKAVKNSVEIENMKKAHVKDGVAVTRFIFWLKHQVGKEPIDEISAARHLEALRAQEEGFLGPSFETISAYAEHGAICHYCAVPQTCLKLEPRGMYLVDSGGQYYEGTTDITRTVVLGPLTQEEKEHFTLVLISMLRLGAVKFLYGCRGISLDYVAREPFWSRGLDYNHGTGHGVGYLLNVHEGPNSFRYRAAGRAQDSAVLEAGMITSDEPGLYIEGSHGIRTENLVLCVQKEKNEYGQFMGFEYLTYVPIDVEGIDMSLMTERDVQLLNDYHQEVYEKISPYLNEEEARWLWQVTAKL